MASSLHWPETEESLRLGFHLKKIVKVEVFVLLDLVIQVCSISLWMVEIRELQIQLLH